MKLTSVPTNLLNNSSVTHILMSSLYHNMEAFEIVFALFYKTLLTLNQKSAVEKIDMGLLVTNFL